ncbi:MAG: Crp/Fnr family transcriptional regulator [Bacillota bacterium]
MQKLDSVLLNNELFSGVAEGEFSQLLACLAPVRKLYEKNETILAQGDPITKIGVLLSGQAQVIRDDITGVRSILTGLAAGDVFAEAFACSDIAELPVSVLAVTDCSAMFFDYQRILKTCSSACSHHTRLIRNLLAVIADKNIMLSAKIEHLSMRTTRKRILSYLSEQASRHNSNRFDIPFNRQQLADYLCVDRSALSIELSKLQKGGILAFQKNHFRLLKHFEL